MSSTTNTRSRISLHRCPCIPSRRLFSPRPSSTAGERAFEQRRVITATHNFLVSVCCLHPGAASSCSVSNGWNKRRAISILVGPASLWTTARELGTRQQQQQQQQQPASSFSLRVLSRFRLQLRHLPPVVADEASRCSEKGESGIGGGERLFRRERPSPFSRLDRAFVSLCLARCCRVRLRSVWGLRGERTGTRFRTLVVANGKEKSERERERESSRGGKTTRETVRERERERREERAASRAVPHSRQGRVGGESVRKVSLKLLQSLGLARSLSRSR